MAILTLSTEDSDIRAGLPASRLVNAYLVPTPNGPTKFAQVDRPGLAPLHTLSGGTVRGEFRKGGVFGGDLFSVVGANVYRGASLLGAITGDGELVRFAASDTELVIVSGGSAYAYNGSGLTLNTDPDLPSVSDVAYLAGRFIYVVQGSDQFYWSAIGNSLSVNGLDFATGESSPDITRTVEVLGDDLIFFGGDTVEFWNPNSDTSAPYVRSSGRRYDKGIRGKTSAVLDNTVFWLGSDNRVYRGGAVPTGVSTDGLEERIAQCSDLDSATAYGAVIKGQTFYVLNLPGVGTWAFQIAMNKWARWSSHDRETFRPSCAATYQGQTYFGDSESAKVWTMDPARFDDDGEPLERVTSVFVPLPSGVARNKNVSLLCAKGVGLATGQGTDPVIELRYSDDVDAEWSPWMQESLGVMGDRQIKTTWWQLGQMQSPGRAFEFRMTDPVPLTAYGFSLNEDRP